MTLIGDMLTSAALPQHTELLGQAATYTTAAGVTTACTVIQGQVRQEDAEDLNGRSWRQSCPIILASAAVADPAQGATVTVDGAVWAIESVDSQHEGFAVLRCSLRNKLEISRPGIRRHGV